MGKSFTTTTEIETKSMATRSGRCCCAVLDLCVSMVGRSASRPEDTLDRLGRGSKDGTMRDVRFEPSDVLKVWYRSVAAH